MQQKKIIISLIFGALFFMGCDLWKKEPSSAVSKLDYEGGKAIINTPGIFTDCTYGLDKSISDHAPVIYGKTATWNIASPAFHKRTFYESGETFFHHKFRARTELDDKQKAGPEDGTLVDLQGNPVIPGERSEAVHPLPTGSRSFPTPNKYYALRLTALAQKIKQLFEDHGLESMALQEIPRDQKDSEDKNLLTHFTEALKPLKYIGAEKTEGVKAPDVALVVREKSTMEAQNPSKELNAQAFCDDTTKDCIISTHYSGNKTFVSPKEKEGLSEEQIAEKETEKIKRLCKELEEFTEILQNYFGTITYLGDFNVSAQKIKDACKWQVAPIIKSYDGKTSCKDNEGNLNEENIDILLEFAPKK